MNCKNLLLTAAVMLLAVPAMAQHYDAYNDFTTVTPTGSPWQYLEVEGTWTDPILPSTVAIQVYNDGSTYFNVWNWRTILLRVRPGIISVPTRIGEPDVSWMAQFIIEPGALYTDHVIQGDGSKVASAVAFVAPSAGYYKIDAQMWDCMQPYGGSMKTAWVYKNTDLVQTTSLVPCDWDASTVTKAPFSQLMNLAAGDQIYFFGTSDGMQYRNMGLTVTADPVTGQPVTGNITFADQADSPDQIGVYVEFSQSGVVVDSDRIFPDASGNYTTKSIAFGTYDVMYKAHGWLHKLVQNVNIIDGAAVNVTLGTNGDLDGDNEITSTDLSILGLNLGITGD